MQSDVIAIKGRILVGLVHDLYVTFSEDLLGRRRLLGRIYCWFSEDLLGLVGFSFLGW